MTSQFKFKCPFLFLNAVVGFDEPDPEKLKENIEAEDDFYVRLLTNINDLSPDIRLGDLDITIEQKSEPNSAPFGKPLI